MDIVTIGEVLIDLTQTGKDEKGIPQFAANPGGAPANLAVAAARLGAQTAFIGKVGADAFGRYLKEVLAENKVDVSGMAVDADHPTTMAVVSVDATGERDFSFYRSANVEQRGYFGRGSESRENRPLWFCQSDRRPLPYCHAGRCCPC